MTLTVVVARVHQDQVRCEWCDRGILAFCFGTGSGLCVVGHDR